MKSIARDKNQITLIYSSATRVGQRTRAHISAVEDKDLKAIDIVENELTGTQWAEIAGELNKEIKDLVVTDELTEDDEVRKGDFNEKDYIKILNERPEVFAHPVAFKGDKAIHITNPTQIQEFINVDSAGLEKKMMHEDPTITSQTKGESFINKPKTDKE